MTKSETLLPISRYSSEAMRSWPGGPRSHACFRRGGGPADTTTGIRRSGTGRRAQCSSRESPASDDEHRPRDGTPAATTSTAAGGTPAPGAGSHAEEVVVRVDHHRVRELPISPAAAADPLAAGVTDGPAQQAPLATELTPAPPPTATTTTTKKTDATSFVLSPLNFCIGAERVERPLRAIHEQLMAKVTVTMADGDAVVLQKPAVVAANVVDVLSPGAGVARVGSHSSREPRQTARHVEGG